MEYQIIRGDSSDIQKVLNQWRHIYNLNIISMHVHYQPNMDCYITILLTRTRKDGKIENS